MFESRWEGGRGSCSGLLIVGVRPVHGGARGRGLHVECRGHVLVSRQRGFHPPWETSLDRIDSRWGRRGGEAESIVYKSRGDASRYRVMCQFQVFLKPDFMRVRQAGEMDQMLQLKIEQTVERDRSLGEDGGKGEAHQSVCLL